VRSKPTSKTHSSEFTRRDFMAASIAVPVGLAGLMASPDAVAATGGPDLDIAEWSFFWVGVERATLPAAANAKGEPSPVVSGKQMYVEYQIPAKVRHPYPIVLVHGGGGQGLDWMGTPDGRRGWATILLEEGYKVYVVDRPGHGRSPCLAWRCRLRAVRTRRYPPSTDPSTIPSCSGPSSSPCAGR